MSKITKYALSDLYEMSSGISSTKEQAGHGAPFVSFGTVFNNYFLPEELPDLMDTNEKEQEIYSIKAGDVLITRTSETIDELAMSCVATKDYPRATFSGFTKRLRPKKEGIAYPKYMAFYFRSDLFRKAVTNNAFMTLRASFNEDIFTFLDVYLPDYDEQVRIGDMLYAVECKIQKNKEINDYLEEMAKALYDYWFVQFDFPDKNGKPYKSSGGALLYNEVLKKEIPFGWTIDTLGNLLSKVPNSTKIPATDFCDKGSIPVIDQSSDFIAGYTDDETSILSNKTGYIVFGDHTRVVKYIRFPFARGADGTQVINSNNRCMPNELFYQVIKSIDLSNYGYARHFKYLKDTIIAIPSANLADIYAEKVGKWYENQVSIMKENIALSQLRNWLLPMLMNGQATIEECNDK